MSYLSMQTELRGTVPKLSQPFAPTIINRAWETVRDMGLWSFQLFEGQWVSPPVFGSLPPWGSNAGAQGRVTVQQGSSIAILDSVATTALNALLPAQSYSLITQRQFRVASSGTGVYNIWGYDPLSGELILDRPYGELSLTNSPFSIYQAFYVPQSNAATLNQDGSLNVQPEYLNDFVTWISVRNIQNFICLYTERWNRAQVDAIDPQRSLYFYPTDVIPYKRDDNPASKTCGYFMFELWGNPTATYTYQLLGLRRGRDLTNPLDTVPRAIGEDLIMAYAKYYAYEWAEANRERGPGARVYYTGPDFKFLMGAAQKDAQRLLTMYRRKDRETVDNWFFVRRSAFSARIPYPYYNSVAGMANAGVLP